MLTGSRVVLFMLVLGSASLSAQENPEPEKKTEPEQSAADFIAQFYGVKPEQVDVTILKRVRTSATAVTKVPGQPTCSLELAPAPESNAKYGWLIGGLACDKAGQEPRKANDA